MDSYTCTKSDQSYRFPIGPDFGLETNLGQRDGVTSAYVLHPL